MGKVAGIYCLFVGVAGILWQWILSQREKQIRLDEVLVFLQKSIFAFDTEKVRLIAHFSNYRSVDVVLEDSLQEIASRLSQNRYPKGIVVWEEVLREKEQCWNFDKETFGLILQAGNGFFGHSCEENICFLRTTVKALEIQKEKIKQKDTQERKVWIPVSILTGMMLIILLI